jgi:hypothetical protein
VDKPHPLTDSEPDSAGHRERFKKVSVGDCDSFIKENENKNTHYKTGWKASVNIETLSKYHLKSLMCFYQDFFLVSRTKI